MKPKEKFNLKEGEYTCPDCGGTGKNLKSKVNKEMMSACFRCWGAGKLDWIEMIMGKKPPHRKFSAKWTIEMEDHLTALFDADVEKEIVDRLSEQIANDVDRQLIQAAKNAAISFSTEKKEA